MPKAGSGGPETYFGNTAPTTATEGDFWDNGIQMRIFIHGAWVNLGGPNVESNV